MTETPVFDFDDPALVAVYDDLPLWSAPFGLMLLEALRLRPGMAALDVGCGTGFPFLELADRLGPDGHVTGLDPWRGGMKRVVEKIRSRGLGNATPVIGDAARMPFADASFDLVVSNNGINNVSDPAAALAECARVARRGAQLVITVNLPGTMQEFYDVYRNLLRVRGGDPAVAVLDRHIDAKRKPEAWTADLVERSGFRIERREQKAFVMLFADGTALFRHFFIRLAFLDPWRAVAPAGMAGEMFGELEKTLNAKARRDGGLRLTVPFLCLSAVRL
jgi:arsenite methyltransferase